jgi:hypothetical protein
MKRTHDVLRVERVDRKTAVFASACRERSKQSIMRGGGTEHRESRGRETKNQTWPAGARHVQRPRFDNGHRWRNRLVAADLRENTRASQLRREPAVLKDAESDAHPSPCVGLPTTDKHGMSDVHAFAPASTEQTSESKTTAVLSPWSGSATDHCAGQWRSLQK